MHKSNLGVLNNQHIDLIKYLPVPLLHVNTIQFIDGIAVTVIKLNAGNANLNRAN